VIAGMIPASLSLIHKPPQDWKKNLSAKIRDHPDSLRIRSKKLILKGGKGRV